jgi:hypothetical protein
MRNRSFVRGVPGLQARLVRGLDQMYFGTVDEF